MKAIIHREHFIEEIGLRPDVLVLLTKADQALCFVLEVNHHETADYLTSKVHTWRYWPKANKYLSRLFRVEIPHFYIAVTGEPVEGTINLNTILKEVA